MKNVNEINCTTRDLVHVCVQLAITILQAILSNCYMFNYHLMVRSTCIYTCSYDMCTCRSTVLCVCDMHLHKKCLHVYTCTCMLERKGGVTILSFVCILFHSQ